MTTSASLAAIATRIDMLEIRDAEDPLSPWCRSMHRVPSTTTEAGFGQDAYGVSITDVSSWDPTPPQLLLESPTTPTKRFSVGFHARISQIYPIGDALSQAPC